MFPKDWANYENLDNQTVFMETTDTFDLHKVSRKRKISDTEKLDREQPSPENDLIWKNYRKKKNDVSSLSLTPFKCKMKCVSRCNRWSDWLIHMDETISEFKYFSYSVNERNVGSNLTSFTSDCSSELDSKKTIQIKDVSSERHSFGQPKVHMAFPWMKSGCTTQENV